MDGLAVAVPSLAISGNETKQEGKDYRADGCDYDAHDDSVFADAAETQMKRDEAADHGPNQAHNHVYEEAEA